MKTITTVEELEALPEGAVIAFEDIGTPSAAVLASTEDGPRWWTTVDAPSANGDGYPHDSIWRCYGEYGEPGITLIHPLVFTAEDVDRAAEALRDDKANRAEYYHVPEWADTPYGDKLVYRSAARAALGAVGEVEQELREAVTDETPLTIDQYQEQAAKTAIYPYDQAMNYLVAGLAGEVGELASIFAKHWRGDGDLNHDHAKAELGDVLWFVAMLTEWLDTDLSEVAQNNLNKLADRAVRGKLKGNGDNR